MTASLSWLDHSEHERQKYLHVIDMFREQGTVDELGIGTVRDAFADLLFPGTSTIQTRAGYFLIVPWMYQEFERQKVPSQNIERAARNAEIRLIDALVGGGERDGVIGITARRTLKRLPSNVYWNGLLSWGIRLFPGSQPQYQRSMDTFNGATTRAIRNDDGEAEAVHANWHPHLPPPPSGFPKEATLSLRRVDAEYLRERIKARHPQTMLASLVSIRGNTPPTGFPWEDPRAPALPPGIADQLHHAQCFAEVMHGATLLYNLMLSQALANEELSGMYSDLLTGWSELIEQRRGALTVWDRERFWRHAEPAGRNLLRDLFIDTWIDLALTPGVSATIGTNPSARKLIEQRENQLKRGLARLQNERALALWNGFSGAAMLTYRWPVTQRMLADIEEGLARRA